MSLNAILNDSTNMADYDSDSSGAEDIETNVLLGYASKEPTSDDFSQLGGHPVRILTGVEVYGERG